ncbi:hypothetical protein [Baekduia sp. Peel2402]|uniref:hypothetical protein n=1 Tax=Baekduia sp. Peel2402 TaxID=3458296 RepID=UPI00403EB970
MRRALLALAALTAATATAAVPSAALAQDGNGTLIGGSVSSTLSLDLAQTGATVRAVVTTTEPDSRLSAAPADGRAGLSAAVSGPYALLDPVFGLTLVSWTGVLAGKATTLYLKPASPMASPSTVLITLSTTTP